MFSLLFHHLIELSICCLSMKWWNNKENRLFKMSSNPQRIMSWKYDESLCGLEQTDDSLHIFYFGTLKSTVLFILSSIIISCLLVGNALTTLKFPKIHIMIDDKMKRTQNRKYLHRVYGRRWSKKANANRFASVINIKHKR